MKLCRNKGGLGRHDNTSLCIQGGECCPTWYLGNIQFVRKLWEYLSNTLICKYLTW